MHRCSCPAVHDHGVAYQLEFDRDKKQNSRRNRIIHSYTRASIYIAAPTGQRNRSAPRQRRNQSPGTIIHVYLSTSSLIATMTPKEFVFKRVGELEIVLDVYLPDEATAENPASVCVWWHGGGCEWGANDDLVWGTLIGGISFLQYSRLALITGSIRSSDADRVVLSLHREQEKVRPIVIAGALAGRLISSRYLLPSQGVLRTC